MIRASVSAKAPGQEKTKNSEKVASLVPKGSPQKIDAKSMPSITIRFGCVSISILVYFNLGVWVKSFLRFIFGFSCSSIWRLLLHAKNFESLITASTRKENISTISVLYAVVWRHHPSI